jgi:hypothetical protein
MATLTVHYRSREVRVLDNIRECRLGDHDLMMFEDRSDWPHVVPIKAIDWIEVTEPQPG